MKEQKYSIVSNIIYALKNIWKWDKAFYLFFIPLIPFNIILPLCSIYFPKIIIDAISIKQSMWLIIMTISIYFLLCFL